MLITLCALLLLCTAHCSGSARQPKVVVVVANRLVLSDLGDPSLPTIQKMLREGGIGLISPNCAGPKSEASVLLTANAGSPCRGGSYVREFYSASELLPDGTTAGEAYALRTGRRAPDGSAVLLGIGQALRDAGKLSSVPTKLGTLGDSLHAAGLKTSASGNADVPPGGIDRSAWVLGMDSAGALDVAGPSSTSSGWLPSAFSGTGEGPHPSPPHGGEGAFGLPSTGSGLLRSPSSRTGEGPHPNPPHGGEGAFAVVYFGASTVLDETKLSMSDAAYAVRRMEMLRSLDRVLGELISKPGSKDTRFMLVSFSPPSGTPWDQLTPIAVYPTERPGLLGSSTTRTPGVIGATDFAPTVLGLLDLPPSEDMIGRAAIVVPQGRGVEKLADMSTRVTTNQRVLTPVAVFLVALGALSFTPTALIIAFGLRPSRRMLGLLRAGLVVGSTTFGALLLAVLAPAGAVGYVAGMAVSMALLTVLCLGLAWSFRRQEMRKSRERGHVRALPVVLVYGATALIILIDALTGCYLCKWSGPSSYQITGMRFYGVGNEYAGVLVSMAALAALFSGRRWLVAVAGLAVVLVLGLGNLGANYGGTAATVVTFVLLWLAVSREGFGARHVVLAFALAIAAVIGFAVLDWTLSGSAGSHAARATGLTEKLGGGYLAAMAMRKVLFNLRITFSVTGLRYALAFVPFLAIWFWGLRPRISMHRGRTPLTGMKAVLIGAAAAFMFNDSGIIFAGIMIAMTVLVLLYSVLEEVRPHPSPLLQGEGAGCASSSAAEGAGCASSSAAEGAGCASPSATEGEAGPCRES